jgi:Zn-dependent metalloprotease
MSMTWPRWPLLLASLFTAGSSLAGEKLTPLSQPALLQLKARELSRAETSLATLRAGKMDLGLNTRDDFQLSGAQTDRFGITHAHFQQLYQGVPVWGAMAITHLDASGLPMPVTSEGLRTGIRLSVNPTVDASDALSLAILELSPRGLLGAGSTAELVIYPETRRVNLAPDKPAGQLNAVDFTEEVVGYRLAWHVHTELDNPKDGILHTDFLLDARSGEVLTKWNSLQTAAATGTGHSQYSGDVRLDVWQKPDGSYELRDTTRSLGEGNRTYDAAHLPTQPIDLGKHVLYTDPDNTWGDGQNYVPKGDTRNDNGQTAAVDTHYGLAQTWDYFKKIHGRWGIDDKGSPTFNRVHVSNAYDNAFWLDSCFCMSYGDGAYPAAGGMKVMTSLDVSAHELSHGITSRTSKLIYAGESGGLNEATSDIFGTMTEFWVRGGRGDTIGNTGGNWDIGEDLSAPPLRHMYKPSKDGASVDAWYPGVAAIDVHLNSGPMNRAFYFLSQGAKTTETPNDYSSSYLPGGMQGIGNDKAAAIWYRAITVYLYPSSNYVMARTASLRSAEDLFGAQSAEYRAVQNAFAAINVGSPASASPYDDRTPPTAVHASVSGSAPALLLNATASDNVGVTRVEFYVDGTQLAADVSLPFQVPLDANLYNDGAHQLYVIAYDAAGSRTQSDPVTFNVAKSFAQLLQNPGFELLAQGWDPVDGLYNVGARSGRYFSYLNGYGDGEEHTEAVGQVVTFPASVTQAALTLYLNIRTQETGTTANDVIKVQVRDTAGTVLETLATWSNLDAKLGWVQRSFDVSKYAGQTVQIYVVGYEGPELATDFQLDDFALRVMQGSDTEAPAVVTRVAGSGDTLDVFADVTDNGYVGSVELFLDGASQGTAAQSFVWRLDRTKFSEGLHTLVTRATDAAGNTADSAPVRISVDNKRVQLIKNPGFEDTSSTGRANWPISTNVTNAARFLLPTPPATTNSFARTGVATFLFNSRAGLSSPTVHQTVIIPADATSAIYSFWVRIYGQSFTDNQVHHTLTAKVRDSSGTSTLRTLKTFSNLDDTSTVYYQHSFDLSAFKGQTIQLAFEGDFTQPATIPNGATQVFIDDLALNVATIQDKLPPTVAAAVSGTYGTISLSASASDNIWTSSLELSVDGTSVAMRTDPSGTLQVSFDASGLTNGPHTLLARAVDSSGNAGQTTVSFDIHNSTVKDVGAPNVSASVDGLFETTVLAANAVDDTGVTRVEFYVDGAFKGRALAPPYQLAFNPIPLSVGNHTLEVVAYDAYGHAGKSTTTFTRETVSVALSATRIGVPVGGSAHFTASVDKVVDTSVTWSVQEGHVCGDIHTDGTYAAPDAPALCHIRATSNVDTSASTAATINVFTADLNGDGLVDGEDMARVAQAYSATETEPTYSVSTDFDASGAVDDNDVTLFVSQFGR